MNGSNKQKSFRSCCVLLLLTLATHAACAGPLSERIAGRAALQQDDALEDQGDGGIASLRLPPGSQRLQDIAYGPEDAQRFDVYLPSKARNAPTIFMVHGGAWEKGDKAMRAVVANKAAHWVSRGFIFISANYRLVPKVAPLEQAEDVARALATAQRKAAEWGGDPARFILMGHSAGAHLVALLAAAPERAARLGALPWLGTVALDSAALDVVRIMEQRHPRLYDRAFGSDPGYWNMVSPYHQLTAGAAPILAVCSIRRDASCSQAHRFAAGAQALGNRVQVSEQDLTHRAINLMLGAQNRYTEEVDAFLRTLLH